MSEKSQLQNKISKKQTELQNSCSRVSSLNGRIERIKAIIQEFTDFKSDIKDLKSNGKSIAGKEYDYWNGDRFDKYKDKLSDNLINGSLSDYISKIDRNLDDLNDELMRLQNEVYSSEGFIGMLKSDINWLKTKIENLVN
ncbi:DUF5082 domain-containing protein [Bacillus sp. DNRA2]|uniref:DUF5082 family protein n=1 Tax=Bacillus sp. DNRA2 TaxID=2723053 RepID=UPI00145E579F|nr:DUF5082 family protein [Bacillus sp. DNRA2]NMD71580.1 DUF5082 domain-containing protein [Bacillus sp. DNRA2]